MNSSLINRNSEYLEKLKSFLESGNMSFAEIRGISKPGVYAISFEDKIIYVGKTTRSGKTRIGELSADYRSHTLNRKLLRDYLETKLSQKLDKFNKGTKSLLITSGTISEDEFVVAQKVINDRVKEEFQFKFVELDSNEITSFEHFAIALLQPRYND